MKKTILVSLMLMILVGASVWGFHTTQIFSNYAQLEPLLEGWNGSLQELDDALRYACKNPTGLYETYYKRDFSNLDNLKFLCKYVTATRIGGGKTFRIAFDVGYKFYPTTKYCTYNWNTKNFVCINRDINKIFISGFPLPLPD